MSQEENQNRRKLALKNIKELEGLPDDELAHISTERAKKFGGIGIEGRLHSGQYQKYQYTNVGMEYVVNDIEEYVIPECQQACRLLWSKNIETFMSSNHQDQDLYVLLSKLSNENQKIFDEMSKNDKRYFFDESTHYYGIRVNGAGEESVNDLNSLTETFSIQDVEERRYMTADDFLKDYKYQDGPMAGIDKYGNIHRGINPTLKDVSFLDALQATKSQGLYVEEEDRVYESQMYLEWHKRYLKSVDLKS